MKDLPLTILNEIGNSKIAPQSGAEAVLPAGKLGFLPKFMLLFRLPGEFGYN